MPPRNLIARIAALLLFVVLCLAAACGGGSNKTTGSTGQLTDPQNVPTATPWQQAPDPVLLDPNNIHPLPPNEPNSGPTDTPAPGQPGVCGQTYQVEAGDTMFGIADKCGIDPQALIAANPNADPADLHIGDTLVLPAPSSDTPTPSSDTATPTDTTGQ